jgi:hypothetical protein
MRLPGFACSLEARPTPTSRRSRAWSRCRKRSTSWPDASRRSGRYWRAAQKAALQAIYKDLDALLPKRNFIVHGETREGEFKGKPRQTYRVGLVKNNLEYLDEFDRGEHGPNIFDVSQVKAASQNCRKILKAIADLRSSIPVSDEPYEEEPDDPADWPPPAR